MRARTVGSGALGVLALSLGLVYMFAPETAMQLPGLTVVTDVLQGVDPSILLTGIGGMLSLYALVGAWASGNTTPEPDTASSTSRYETARQLPPERVVDDDRTSVEALVPAELEAEELTEQEAQDARSLLRETTQALLATTDDPAHALDDGSWTDTSLAAAFLSDDAEHSVWSRLRLWLDPERERARRVRVTAREVNTLADAVTQEESS